ncbi:Asp-tRNA(Asn)/Glu-tRNA(Gln) amidotransferase subunit GatA [Acetatifactor muris]|uniref:Glutamyl-tRNA(Gln) amidotransferase subunit A n=1 Tax=Acetatifactor muris TaxID=879566 RepID=A0A2K4ZAH5_9FIRM|nr:Asp-tRNA(Asn)/Glu-tRNA(Gln) amidotransferase subunit GatA [Acetatifactor muris]MCR2047543.1 Asp-tRNA(Asn)/Glu-tRNA(Gln) amidotransferase subunit GatA [Acetatifactor muris]SOY27439.1 Glutamyl-tRNA(Gln) amidotransferase subunit A [Acetatifactor muris]
MELLSLSASELGRAIREGRTTAVEAMEAVLEQIEEKEKIYHCYVTVDTEGALRRAEEVQKRIVAGELTGPLAGVPVAVKDNLCTQGLLTTCSSRMLRNFIPPYSAEAVKSLERAGAVLIGKTNMDEFAMGSTTETSVCGPTCNPHNPEHVPGGSSGGSAAAVAAGECFFALGSDTGGSIRQPASHCGVVGLKPTYGTVSRFGLVAYGSSLDQIGPLCRTVEDCAVILEILASGKGEEKGIIRDSTLMEREEVDFTAALIEDVTGMRIGIPKAWLADRAAGGTEEGLDSEVREAVLNAAEVLRKKGAVIEEFDLDLAEYAVPTYYTIACAEASSNLERFDGVKYGYRAESVEELHQMYKKTRSAGFGPEVKRRIMLGSFVLSSGYYDAFYLKALRVKAMIKKAFDEAFAKYDCILGPVAPTTAPKLGESLSDPLKMYLGDIYTVSVNLAGLPAVSIPCGMDKRGLPIGLQLIGDCFQEKKILRAAYTYESCSGRTVKLYNRRHRR